MEIKFNLDLDDFYIDEDRSLKDEIKNKIVNMAVEKLYQKIENNYEDQVSDIIKNKIESLVENTFKDFTEKTVIVTDKYGSKKDEGTVEELIKKRFDKWLLDGVDNDGRIVNYNPSYTRIEYLIESQLNKHSQRFVSDAVGAIASKLEKTLSEDLRDAIGKKIADKIGLNKLLPKMIR